MIIYKSKDYFRKVWILIMTCSVLFVVFNTGVFAETKRKPTIRSIILAQHPYDPTKPETVELLKKYKNIGINYVTLRTWWSQIEKKPGEYDFSYIDAILDNVRKAGLKVILRLAANSPPDWLWTYGKEIALTSGEAGKCVHGGKVDLNKLSVYPMIEPDGTIAYNSSVDPWDGTGNFFKLKFLSEACKHLKDKKYDDVVEYLNVGILEEGIWGVSAINFARKMLVTKTWAPTALDSYRRYLQEKYMNVKDVNKIYNMNWKSFWEAEPPKTYEDTQYFWDWRKWFERGMVVLFMREASIVRRAGFKVSVLSHLIGIDSRDNPIPSPNPAALWCGFLNPSRLELIDADLYVLGGGYSPITWHDDIPYDPSNNLLVIAPFEGYDNLRKKSDALYIMEDWGPNPALVEYIGVVALMLDGFQVMEGTFSHSPPRGSSAEVEFNKLKEAIRIFWLWEDDMKKK